MRSFIAVSVAIALSGVAVLAHAQKLSCYEDPRTNANTCYSPSKLRETNGIRHSPLYTGGPNGVRDTGMSIHINCATKVVHLKDRDGVSFAGGKGNETPAVRSLSKWICAESIPKK